MKVVERCALATPASPRFRPVFILGAPRAGTTIVYQYLLSRFHWAYLTNRERKHSYAPITSARIWKGARKYSPSFQSNYGNVEGANAPSDGWEVFHRWFTYFYDPELTSAKLAELRTTVAKIESVYGWPFIVKNNANSLRIFELGNLFASAFFVIVHRNVQDNVMSLLSARRANHVAAHAFWSSAPDPRLVDCSFDSEVDLVTFQYYFNVCFLAHCQQPRFDSMTVDYDEFVSNPSALDAVFVNALHEPRLRARAEPSCHTGVRQRDRQISPTLADQIARSAARNEPVAKRLVEKLIRDYHSQ